MVEPTDDVRATESQILAAYLPKLIRLAERNMSAQLQQKVGADDVGQTVLRTVIRRLNAGMLNIEESEEFWRLLVTITLNKVRKKARHYSAVKRNSQLEQPMAIDPIDYRALQENPSSDEGDEFAELLLKLKDRLDDTCNAILAAKLEEKKHHDIAAELGISSRSVSRALVKIADEIRALAQE